MRSKTVLGALSACGFLVAGVFLGTVGARPAAADPSEQQTAGTTPELASGASSLGGFTLSAAGSGVSVFYFQPNFFLPANPALEWDLGYSTAGYDAGPSGHATAAALWPGPVIAGGGSQLGLLFGPYLDQYAPQLSPTVEPLIPTNLNWPIQASTNYPQGPQTSSNVNGPLYMDASSTASGSDATSAINKVGGDKSLLQAGLVSVQSSGSTSLDSIDSTGHAVAQSTSSAQGVDILAGIMDVGQVTSVASAASDGAQATLSGTSTVSQVTIGGIPVTVDDSGVHAVGQNADAVSPLTSAVNQILSAAGITVKLTSPQDKSNGATGSRELEGLQVNIDLATYDQNFAKLLSMLPPQLRAGLDQLPVPTPYKQDVIVDLGWVNVKSAASPAFSATSGLTDLSAIASAGGEGGSFNPGISGGSPVGSSGGSPSQSATGTPSSGSGAPAPAFMASTPASLFKGVGTGLLLVGLALAGLLAFALMRTDKALAAALDADPTCAGEFLGDVG